MIWGKKPIFGNTHMWPGIIHVFFLLTSCTATLLFPLCQSSSDMIIELDEDKRAVCLLSLSSSLYQLTWTFWFISWFYWFYLIHWLSIVCSVSKKLFLLVAKPSERVGIQRKTDFLGFLWYKYASMSAASGNVHFLEVSRPKQALLCIARLAFQA